MNLSKKVANLLKNIGFITIGNFASKLLNFFLVPVYTAKLTTAEYGAADLMFTTLSLLLPVLTLEINEAVMRFSLSGNKEKNRTYFSIGVYLSAAGTAAFLLLLPVTLLVQAFRPYWAYIIAVYVSNVAYLCLTQYAKGNRFVKQYATAGFINTIMTAVLNILFLVGLGYKVEGYLLSYAGGSVFGALYLLYALRGHVRLTSLAEIGSEEIKEMLKYSIPLIPNAVCWWINNASDKYILAFFCSTSVVGLYSIAYKIPSLLSVTTSIFFSAWQISAVEDYGKKECQIFYSKIYRVFFVLNAIVCIVLFALSKHIAYVLYANEFFEAWKYAIVLVGAFFFNSLSTFLGSIYTTAKKTKMLFASTVLAAVINIVMNLILIPFWGAMGAAVATLIGYGVVFVFRVFHTRKIIPIDYHWTECVILMVMMLGVAILCLQDMLVAGLALSGGTCICAAAAMVIEMRKKRG